MRDHHLPGFDPNTIRSVRYEGRINRHVFHFFPGFRFSYASNAIEKKSNLDDELSLFCCLAFGYLMPWPGPHIMLLMEICEEFLTMETQSSPAYTHKKTDTQLSNMERILTIDV